MDKKLQTTITVELSVLLVGGGIFFGITQAKRGHALFAVNIFRTGKSWGTNCAARKMIPILPLAVEQKPQLRRVKYNTSPRRDYVPRGVDQR